MNLTSYKFSPAHAVPPVAPDILKGTTPKAFLEQKYDGGISFGIDNLKRLGEYRIRGYCYDFKPFLRLFWAMDKGGHIGQYYAPSKKLLRSSVNFTLVKIVEIQKED